MPPAVTHIILNPTSGAGRAYRERDAIVRELAQRGVEAVLHLTEAAGHGVTLARDLANGGAERIVAAGGDGTIHDVANGILQAGTGAALGVLPLGTGNDFAKVIPGSRTPFDTIARGKVVRYDAGYARWASGEEYFINGMGTGIDVEVVRQIHRLPALPGPLKYLLGLLRALASYKPVSVAAVDNGQRSEHTVMMMALGNGICQGGGFYLTPQARPDDGRLNLCVIDSIPLWRVPGILPLVLRGKHERHKAVTARSLERVRFEARGTDPLYFQLDGELREPADGHWLDIEIKPGALPVITLEMKQ